MLVPLMCPWDGQEIAKINLAFVSQATIDALIDCHWAYKGCVCNWRDKP